MAEYGMKRVLPNVISDEPLSADKAIVWHQDRLYLIDQRILPHEEMLIECNSAQDVADAIREMVVRGAPAIGITAAYGVVLAARYHFEASGVAWRSSIRADLKMLADARPTAVNLFWALQRMQACFEQIEKDNPVPVLLTEAKKIHEEDFAANRLIGSLGASLIEDPCAVITHCNAGALATGGYGTALGVIRSAHAQGKVDRVYADETRPWLQGSRLTSWELARDAIPVSLLSDGAAAARMQAGGVDWVIVGSDRIAANGDVANKIGTYGLAVAARHHGVRFMVAAPTSTIDMSVASGDLIPIEERSEQEVLSCGGKVIAPADVGAWNPVFDVTPAELVDAIVTEKGVIHSPNREKIAEHMADSPQNR